MTHPNILTMERFGELEPMRNVRKIGECRYCGAPLYDGYDTDIILDADAVYCNMRCRRNHMRSDGSAVLSDQPMKCGQHFT